MEWFLPALTLAILASAALHLLADGLNYVRSRKAALPAALGSWMSAEEFARAGEYLRAQTTFRAWRLLSWALASLLFLWGGGFGAIDRLALSLGLGDPWVSLVYFALLGLLTEIFGLPFELWHTFKLEARFGFNRTSLGTFVLDRLKGAALAAVIGGPFLAGLLWVLGALGSAAWVWAWGFAVAAQLLIAFLAPVLLLPLFYKLTPLAEGDLKNGIEAYAKKVDFGLAGVFTMDGSRRSAKANAFFTGFGRFRRIVLFDTLVEKHPPRELVAVLAHEVGHFKLKHVPKRMALGLLSSLGLFYLLGWALQAPEAAAAFGLEPSLRAGLTVALWVFTPLSELVSLLMQAVSRKHEFEADAFAARTGGDAQGLAEGLLRLSRDQLSFPDPHPLKVFLEYSHPPVLERVKALHLGQPAS